MTIKFDHLNYFHQLKSLAAQDLSSAHILQHSTGAKFTANLANIYPEGEGAYSVSKPTDTVEFVDGKISGLKRWVSNLGDAKWAILNVRDNNAVSIVLVYFDDSTLIKLIPTVGMEGTVTGDIIFNNTPAIRLFDKEDLTYFLVQKQVSIGFVTNCLGLCESLFSDINLHTTRANINCEFDKKKLKLSIDVLKLLWLSSLGLVDQDIAINTFWHDHKVSLAYAKKTLIDICQFINETTGSGLYEIGTTYHQRHNDALIYSSHMKNLYITLSELYPTKDLK